MDCIIRVAWLVIGLWLAAGLAVAQEKKADATGGAPVGEILAELQKAFKQRHEPNATAALEKALTAIKEKTRSAREKSQILKAMAGGLDNRNGKIKLAAASALGRVGPLAAKVLKKALKSKIVQKNGELMAAVIDALGLTRDEKVAVPTLLSIVNAYKDWTFRALAARALGNFDKTVAMGKTRKAICEKLIQIYEGIESQASDGRDSDARRKLQAIQGDFVATLRTLTEQEWNRSLDWRKWFNKAKKSRKLWPNPPKKKPGSK